MAEISDDNGGQKQNGKKVRSKKSSTKIDMTPMVDLAFLLLTFFMLTTTFIKPQTMEITLPEKPKEGDKQPLVNEKRVLTVILDNNDKIYWFMGITDPVVETTDFSKDGIRRILSEKNKSVSNLVVLIKPNEKAKYENIVDILDEMSISNVARYALVDITTEDKNLVDKAKL